MLGKLWGVGSVYSHLKDGIVNLLADGVGVVPCTGQTTVNTTSCIKVTIRARPIKRMFKKVCENS